MPTPDGMTGAPRRLLTLACTLREYDVHFCIAAPRDSDLFEIANEAGLETVDISPKGALALRRGALSKGSIFFGASLLLKLFMHNVRVAFEIRKVSANLTWLRGSKGVAFGGLGCLLSRRPVVWDIDYEPESSGSVRWLHRFGLWLCSCALFQYKAAPEDIFPAQLTRSYAEKFQCIVPGVDLAPLQAFREARQKSPKTGRSSFTILHVGSICERKNQRLSVHALALVKRWVEIPVRLQLVGDSFDCNYLNLLSSLVTQYGLNNEVEFLGWQQDTGQILSQADLLLMPSLNEGVPNTVQEAMAVGVPVLVSSAGGMSELVEDGKTGRVLGLRDAADWALAVCECLSDMQTIDQMGRQAALYADQNFDKHSWARKYVKTLRHVNGGN